MRRLPKYVERSRGKFRGAIRIRGYRYKTETFASADVAHTKAVELKLMLTDPSSFVTIGKAMDDLLEEVSEKRSEGTRSWYECQFRALNKVIRRTTPLMRVNPALIEKFISRRLKEVSSNTVVQQLRALHRVFERAVRKDLAKENPLKKVDYPKETRTKMSYFEPSDLTGMIEVAQEADPEAADLFCLMAYTGLRKAEIIGILCDDIDLKGRQMWIGAGKSRSESIPINAMLVPVLRRMLEASDGKGCLLGDGERQWVRVVRRLKRIFGKKMSGSRVMRHTFVTALVRGDVPMHVVQQLSRHKTHAMVMRYYHQGNEARDAIGKLPY